MNTYVYTTGSVDITVEANDEDAAYCALQDKIREIADLGVEVPPPWIFELWSEWS